MSPSQLEDRLVKAFSEARTSMFENPDLFARVARTVSDARERRRFRLTLAAWTFVFIAANALLAISLSDFDNRRFNMQWWVIELITNIVLVALAVGLGPFIKRFGRSYAADVFRANPRTGKSYLVLTDVAYYLIFTAFILFTTSFVQRPTWRLSTGKQVEAESIRVGGMLLIMGILHGLNVVALPIIGRLLSDDERTTARSDPQPVASSASMPPMGPGTWIVRIEEAPPAI